MRFACLVLLVGALAPTTFATPLRLATSVSGEPRPPDVPALAKLANAKDELARADELRRAVRGKAKDERALARRAAVDAYRSVREHFPQDSAACAEAAFRAGELLRAGGDPEGAKNELQAARTRGAGTPFRVRAMLELGQLARRAKDFETALEAFDAVVADAESTQRQKDDASLWAGRAHAELGRADDARRAWQRVAEGAEDPLDRIRAWDWMAQALVDASDLEGAAGALERCRDALADVASEETKVGERVRNALTSMRAHDELARAIAARDAQRAKSSDESADGAKKSSKRARDERSKRD